MYTCQVSVERREGKSKKLITGFRHRTLLPDRLQVWMATLELTEEE